MTITHERPYQGTADLSAMRVLANAYPDRNVHSADLPYRFSSWALDRSENARLWEDEAGQLLAWAVLQAPFWMIDLSLHPKADPGLLDEILAWADHQARSRVNTPFGRPSWFIPVFSDAPERIERIEAAGFASQANVGPDSWTQVLLSNPLGRAVPEAPVPDGFHIRPLQGRSEAKLYTFLHRSVFESTNMTHDWRLRTLLQQSYQAETDLVAVAPDGRLAAFCIGWLNKDAVEGITGQIEPLGVEAQYRGSGLGQAILSECLRRMERLGAQKVLVETDGFRGPALRMYESTGFLKQRDVLIFRKDYRS